MSTWSRPSRSWWLLLIGGAAYTGLFALISHDQGLGALFVFYNLLLGYPILGCAYWAGKRDGALWERSRRNSVEEP